MPSTYRVTIDKEQLSFAAAHFVTYGHDICEPLHGHNWRVKCEVHGGLGRHAMVVDFVWLRDALAELVRQLDHSVLLPSRHPLIRVSTAGAETTVTFGPRRWVFPTSDCRVLDVDNTTAERLAEVLAEQLAAKLAAASIAHDRLIVAVDENHGQWATVELKK
jgi:6-pyruvoyltetrahydropterin/6-carboxytetrahydropterin synthase